MTISDLPAIIGAMLAVVGNILVLVQFFRSEGGHAPMRSATVSPKGFNIRTTYPGLVMIAFGTVLLLGGRLIG